MPNSGDQFLLMLGALANPHRLKIISMLKENGRNYVSQLAREVGISRPLLHLHLQKLETAGLVKSKLEFSNDGKALKYFELASFKIIITPLTVTKAVQTLTYNTTNSD